MLRPLLVSTLLLASACSGVRSTSNTFSTHAESLRIVGIPIPEDDQAAARALVPAGAEITSVHSTPADWTSFFGVLGNVFWIHQTVISGTK